MESIEAFPLSWPSHFERSKFKTESTFKCTLSQSRDGVLAELERLGAKRVIISSNIPLKRDGQMYANEKPLNGDHGVAVYFIFDGEQRVLACDAYFTIRENLRAIEKSVDAMRGLGRWKVSNMLKAAFTGFKTLAEKAPKKFWYEILEVDRFASAADIKSAYREKAKLYHPDKGGDPEKFNELMETWELILKLKIV